MQFQTSVAVYHNPFKTTFRERPANSPDGEQHILCELGDDLVRRAALAGSFFLLETVAQAQQNLFKLLRIIVASQTYKLSPSPTSQHALPSVLASSNLNLRPLPLIPPLPGEFNL